MNIDDVLLTDGQQSQAIQQGAKGWFAALNTPAGNEFLESIADSLCKAQCLKLLEYLREHDALDHSYHTGEIIVEIEKLLKGGLDEAEPNKST